MPVLTGVKLPSAARLRRHWRATAFDQRQRLIVDVALDLLIRRGPHAVTMRRVAQRLGVGAMTLYTYVHSQEELLRCMVRRGFEMMHERCRASNTLGSDRPWRGGALAYLHFALHNPRLYELMFSTPVATPAETEAQRMLTSGFAPLLERVRERLASRGLAGEELDRQARAAAGRYWIGLHGLASLAIANRLIVLQRPVEDLLDDLLTRVAPE